MKITITALGMGFLPNLKIARKNKLDFLKTRILSLDTFTKEGSLYINMLVIHRSDQC